MCPVCSPSMLLPLAGPRILCSQKTSKYVNTDTFKFLCNPGLDYNTVQSSGSPLSFITYLLKTLAPPLFSLPLNSVRLHMSWPTFSIVLFADFSALAGLLFTHCFLILLVCSFSMSFIKLLPWPGTFASFFLPVYILWLLTSSLSLPRNFMNHYT